MRQADGTWNKFEKHLSHFLETKAKNVAEELAAEAERKKHHHDTIAESFRKHKNAFHRWYAAVTERHAADRQHFAERRQHDEEFKRTREAEAARREAMKRDRESHETMQHLDALESNLRRLGIDDQ
jgi:hypothetical protein